MLPLQEHTTYNPYMFCFISFVFLLSF